MKSAKEIQYDINYKLIKLENNPEINKKLKECLVYINEQIIEASNIFDNTILCKIKYPKSTCKTPNNMYYALYKRVINRELRNLGYYVEQFGSPFLGGEELSFFIRISWEDKLKTPQEERKY